MRTSCLVVAVIDLCLALVFVAVVAPPALFADEPAPDANACIVTCKADCANDAAAAYADCLIDHPIGYEEICTQYASAFLGICKELCEGDHCGSPV